jgi:cephalosporin hydroxylase
MGKLASSSPLARSLDMSLREWIEFFQNKIVTENVRYRGVLTWKNILDLWIVQEIIHDTQPEVVVEIGSKFGGTTLWLSDVMRSVGSGRVISIDLVRPATNFPDNVQFVQGDSVASETVATVEESRDSRRTMVMADGNHAADHVLAELELYSPMVAPGCYFIVEDGIVDVMAWQQYTPGPLVAVQKFLCTNNQFVIDESREKFILTYAPSGFLKRQ